MECIHCTQCADACDDIMTKVGRPLGLIRYTSRAELEAKGAPTRKLRPRTILYPAALAVTFGGFLFALMTRSSADVTVLRGLGAPYVIEADGRVANQLRVKITNRTSSTRRYTIAIDSIADGTMIAPRNPLSVAPGQTEMTDLFLMLPQSAFHDGEKHVIVRIADDALYGERVSFRLLGPERESHERDSGERDGRGR
jgi:polyferredoxin